MAWKNIPPLWRLLEGGAGDRAWQQRQRCSVENGNPPLQVLGGSKEAERGRSGKLLAQGQTGHLRSGIWSQSTRIT